MNKYKAVLLFMVGLLSVAAIGCGGSGDSGDSSTSGSGTSTETPAPTKAEFVATADKICAGIGTELDKLGGKLDENSTKQDALELVKSGFLPLIDAKVQDLRDVTPPEGDEEEITAWLDELQSGLDEVKTKPEMVFEDVDPFEKADAMASDYGLKECGASS